MKTKRFCKSTVSMILALIMLVSMCTVAFLNTAAAETDVAQTGATITGGTTFYLSPNENWKKDGARFAAYFCNGSSAAHWYSAYGPNDDGYYWVTVNSGESHANIIWCRMNGGNTTNDWSTKWDQTNDLTWDGSKNLYTVSEGAWSYGGGSWSSYTPSGGSTTDPSEDSSEDTGDPAEEVEISFLINSDTKWIASDDAKMFIKSGSDIIEMNETVDTKSGHVMWTAEVAAHSSYTFYRTSYFFDESNASTKAWNSWTASSRGTNTVYKATSSSGGSWAAASTVNAADPKDIENFWDDLWIAPFDKNDVDHAVKVYYDGSEFNLFVPSYYNLSNVVVYSDHESVVIGSTTIASGSTASLTTGLDKTFQFKDGSTTTNKGKINIYQTTGTAAMMMTTKEELFTGTTAGLASDNAWPSGSGITADNFNGVYKDAIETKGSYHFYKENGEQANSDTVLKKIKGRGNSSFEASMKIYGKYAYNFNLDKKAELIEGATEAKKWCLLANNPDVSMLRNTFVYQLADEVGVKYAPETRLVDLYDNGKYLGAYILTEKVEYGKNTLMNDMKNLDDGNEDANIEAYGNEDIMDDLEGHLIQDTDTVPVNGQTYTYQYTKSDDETNWPYYQPDDYNEYNFLLEFELFDRYQAEASWFVSPRTGQAVVVKYPEFATKDEMEWIISEYEAAEAAIYANDTDAIKATLDVDSFANMYLIQELAINLDSCATSYYIHNDLASKKLVASPVWDYDWAFGSYANQDGKKYIFNGSNTVDNTTTMDNPEQMFVKNKALRTDSNQPSPINNYNFQAKLVHNDYVWNRCKYLWTNKFVDALNKYIVNPSISGDTSGIMEDTWLDSFSSSLEMNDARWGSINFTGDNWGTKVTSNYNDGSFNFYVGDTSRAGTASKSYDNTVHYLNDWIAKRWDYMSSSASGKGNLYDENLLVEYTVENVSFVGDLNDENGELTITPSATVTLDGVALSGADVSYTVYVDGEAYETYTFAEEATITLADGARSEVYIEVFPTADSSITDTSDVQVFDYGYVAQDVEFTVMFKASGSARYVPKVEVNGTQCPMTKSGDAIGKNATGTQEYYWYEAPVSVKEGESATLLFTNGYSMRATTTISSVVSEKVYYFAVDNMNSGSVVEDLTEATEYVRNFTKSATNMITNDPEKAGVATTSIGGVIYKMGDADGDDEVSILDSTTIQLALAGKTELSDTASALSDFDLDSTTSIMDATNVQVYLANGV